MVGSSPRPSTRIPELTVDADRTIRGVTYRTLQTPSTNAMRCTLHTIQQQQMPPPHRSPNDYRYSTRSSRESWRQLTPCSSRQGAMPCRACRTAQTVNACHWVSPFSSWSTVAQIASKVPVSHASSRLFNPGMVFINARTTSRRSSAPESS